MSTSAAPIWKCGYATSNDVALWKPCLIPTCLYEKNNGDQMKLSIKEAQYSLRPSEISPLFKSSTAYWYQEQRHGSPFADGSASIQSLHCQVRRISHRYRFRSSEEGTRRKRSVQRHSPKYKTVQTRGKARLGGLPGGTLRLCKNVEIGSAIVS